MRDAQIVDVRREVVGASAAGLTRIRRSGSTVSGLFSSYQASGNWLRTLNERSALNRRSSSRTTRSR